MMIISLWGRAPQVAFSATAGAACLATAFRYEPSRSNTLLKPPCGPTSHETLSVGEESLQCLDISGYG